MEGHIAQVNNALNTMQRNLELMIALNVQRGMIQPQIVSLNLLIETLRKSILSFPKDTMAPFLLSKDSSTSVISKICDVHVYISQGILGYVITMPLVIQCTSKVLRLILLLIITDKDKLVYVETEN
jgi:hypothetical protein